MRVHTLIGIGLEYQGRRGTGVDRRAVLGKHTFLCAAFAEKGQIPEPEHIERSQESRDQTHKPEDLSAVRRKICKIKNFILAEEASERRQTADGEDCCGHGPERNGKLAP